jgi:sec-independent protein translocase protein TatC
MSTKPDHDPKEQPLVSHLIELRDRLIRCIICVVVVFLAIFYWSNQIFDFTAKPLTSVMGEGQHMIATKPLDSFFIPFTLTMMVAFFISIPYIMHQIWAFIAPGLYRNEIRVTRPILISSIVLFYTGVVFAYYAVLPMVFKFSVSTAPADVAVMTDISPFYDLVIRMFMVFGFVFEVPVATVLLILAGVVTPDKLVENRGYVIIGCFTIGMILSPPDVFSQSLIALPMWMLFEGGVFAGRILKRKDDDAQKAKAEGSN